MLIYTKRISSTTIESIPPSTKALNITNMIGWDVITIKIVNSDGYDKIVSHFKKSVFSELLLTL